MIEDYLVVAERIRQKLSDLEQVVTRAERAITAARQRPEDMAPQVAPTNAERVTLFASVRIIG